MYDKIVAQDDPVEAVRFNDNVITAMKIMAERLESKQFSFFILSLNTSLLIQKWYAKHLLSIQERLKQEGISIDLTAVMGNQIIWKENDQGERIVKGVIEHVTNNNKKDYIPGGTIMLADNRETEARAKDGVNVVNIEGESFEPYLLDYSCDILQVAQTLRNIDPLSVAPLLQYYEKCCKILQKLKEYNESIEKGMPTDDNALTKEEQQIEELSIDFENTLRHLLLQIDVLKKGKEGEDAKKDDYPRRCKSTDRKNS